MNATQRLGDLVEVFDAARRPIKGLDRVAGVTPYLGASGVVDFVDGFTHVGEYLCVSEDGENLRSRGTPIAWVQQGRFWANNHLHVVGGVSLARLRFLEGALAHVSVMPYLTGSTQPKLSQSALLAIEIPRLGEGPEERVGELLGALDDKVAANRHVAESARALAVTIVSRLAARCAVSDVATQSRSSVNPNTMSDEAVQHYSLPAFDAGAPEVVAPAALMSAKNHLQEPAVLVAKLNPRIPRIWPVPHLGVMPALASPEFVALTPRNTSVGALWGALAHPSFTEKVLTFVAGTTGSHQRVKPEHLLSVSIPDIRQLSSAEDTTVQTLVALTQQVVSENETLAKTRDELLPLLMSGKITVRDAEKRVEGVV